MSTEKKRVSCFGLFMRGFLLTALILANLGIAGIMVAVKFLGADYATWTDMSSYTSYPWLMIFAVLGTAIGVGFLSGIAGALVSAFFGGEKKAGTKKLNTKAKPQSNRRTTV